MAQRVKPLHDRIIVKRLEEESKTKGGRATASLAEPYREILPRMNVLWAGWTPAHGR